MSASQASSSAAPARRRRAAKGKTKYAKGTRSYTMSRIRGKDTSIERIVRSYLFARGMRFRKNDRRYPGHPDVVLSKYHTIVFVNGCFWHMHEGCGGHTMPKTNTAFWREKLQRNRERDRRQHDELRRMGWRVIDVWECELGDATRASRLERLVEQIVDGGRDGQAPPDAVCGSGGTMKAVEHAADSHMSRTRRTGDGKETI
ncbi:very short patch repair endonuclease [Bifidobacterium italicum]|uniref:very short patch repair endonuclease n=1 Tax=Bifidobacterium italicum TaxID=1960968 RepID=UPI00389909B0